MSGATTFWEDLGIGLLAGATILLSSAVWMLLTSEGDQKRLNRIGPSSDVHASRLAPDGAQVTGRTLTGPLSQA
jgi:hypothetical protein